MMMMMMMMIMIAGFVDSITTPIKSWLDGHHNTTNGSMTVLKEKKEEEVGAPVECVSCVVCLSEICLGERFALLERCSHGFHVECVEEWLKDHPNCPLCRAPISTAMAMYDYNHQSHVYFKKSYEIMSGYGFRLLEMMATWLTSSFNMGALQSSLSRTCSYL